MTVPHLGDLVLYEGAAWRVTAQGFSGPRRFGREFRSAGEVYLVLTPAPDDEHVRDTDVKVPASSWHLIRPASPPAESLAT